jgi:hypothetical protein
MNNAYNILIRKSEGPGHLGHRGTDKFILKWIVKK